MLQTVRYWYPGRGRIDRSAWGRPAALLGRFSCRCASAQLHGSPPLRAGARTFALHPVVESAPRRSRRGTGRWSTRRRRRSLPMYHPRRHPPLFSITVFCELPSARPARIYLFSPIYSLMIGRLMTFLGLGLLATIVPPNKPKCVLGHYTLSTSWS